jgi:hypothetical protein
VTTAATVMLVVTLPMRAAAMVVVAAAASAPPPASLGSPLELAELLEVLPELLVVLVVLPELLVVLAGGVPPVPDMVPVAVFEGPQAPTLAPARHPTTAAPMIQIFFMEPPSIGGVYWCARTKSTGAFAPPSLGFLPATSRAPYATTCGISPDPDLLAFDLVIARDGKRAVVNPCTTSWVSSANHFAIQGWLGNSR